MTQRCHGRGPRTGLAVHGGHGNPDWLGLVVACVLPLSLAGVRQRTGAARWFALVCTALAVAALALSGSRTSWIAVTVVLIIHAARGRATWRSAALVAAAFASASAFVVISGPHGWWRALAGRRALWAISGEVARAAFPVGVGSGGFAHAFIEAQGQVLSNMSLDAASLQFVNPTSAHNDWLQALVEGGAPLATLLAVTFAVSVVRLDARWRPGAASLAVIAVSALGDTPLSQPAVVTILGLTLAATPDRPVRARWIHRATLVASFLAVVALLPRAGRTWMATRVLTDARQSIGERRLAQLERAARIDSRHGEVLLELGLQQLARGQPRRALVSLERSRERLANVGTSVAIGNAHLELGQPQEALAAYDHALARHPALVRAHVNAGEVRRRVGRLREATAHLEAARELQPHHPTVVRLAERVRRDRITAETRRESSRPRDAYARP